MAVGLFEYWRWLCFRVATHGDKVMSSVPSFDEDAVRVLGCLLTRTLFGGVEICTGECDPGSEGAHTVGLAGFTSLATKTSTGMPRRRLNNVLLSTHFRMADYLERVVHPRSSLYSWLNSCPLSSCFGSDRLT